MLYKFTGDFIMQKKTTQKTKQRQSNGGNINYKKVQKVPNL